MSDTNPFEAKGPKTTPVEAPVIEPTTETPVSESMQDSAEEIDNNG